MHAHITYGHNICNRPICARKTLKFEVRMAVTLKITVFQDVTPLKSGRRLRAPWFWRTRCVQLPKKSQRTKQLGFLDWRTSQPVNVPQHRSFLTQNYWALCQICGHFGERLLERDACRLRLKCDGTRAETRFSLSAKRTSPFKSAGASVQSTTGSRGVRISGSNVGYTMFRGSVKGTGYPLHSLVSPSLPLPCVTVCHHISTGLYHRSYLPNYEPCYSNRQIVSLQQSVTDKAPAVFNNTNAIYSFTADY